MTALAAEDRAARIEAALAAFADAPPEIKARAYAAVAARVGELRYSTETTEAIRRVKLWRTTARPDQLPPEDDWSVAYLRGGRRSGKTWTGARWLAEMMLDYPGGEWAIVAPTFKDAVTVCVEHRRSGLLAAFGTTPMQVKAGQSPIVAQWNRASGELWLRPEVGGAMLRADSAEEGALRVQGHGLRGAWCDEVGLWKGEWRTTWDESVGNATADAPARRIATGTPKRYMPARGLIRLLLEGDDDNPPADVQRLYKTLDNAANLHERYVERVRARVDQGGSNALQEYDGELLEAGGTLFDVGVMAENVVEDFPRQAAFCRYWDLAGTEVSKKNRDPDWTAGALVAMVGSQFYVVDVVRARGNPQEIRRLMALTRDRDRDTYEHQATRMAIRVEREPGSNSGYALEMIGAELYVGHDYGIDSPSGSKRMRADPVAAAANAGNLRLVRGDWNRVLLDELETFPDGRHDDMTDAISGAFRVLAQRALAPTVVSLPRGQVLRGRR